MASSPIQIYKIQTREILLPYPHPPTPQPNRASLTIYHLENRQSLPQKVQPQEQACVFW